ncbi:MAG: hypothetical protein NVSMB27_12250 [Ktedonobacteraceae bacterium]
MHGVALIPSDRLDMLWLDTNFAMNYHTWKDMDLIPGSPSTNLGGTFTSPPVAVALGQDRLDVFGLGLDYALYHKVHAPAAPVGRQWSPNWENLGGNFTSTPVVVSTADNRIDLFGLGPDQGMLHRAWHGSVVTGISPLPGPGKWSDWDELGGGFTSLPAVLPAASGAFDLFARGLDFMVYHATWTPGTPADWQLLGGGLLGEPSAASAPAAVRVHYETFVFVTGANGAVWYIVFDGKVWKPWVSLGPAHRATTDQDAIAFISEPVAVALFPESDIIVDPGPITTSGTTGAVTTQPPSLVSKRTRVDVFAVGSDKQLWQKTLDHEGWHGEMTHGHETGNWILFGDSFACAPSIVAPTHGATMFVPPPPRFSLVGPSTDGKIHRWWFDSTPTPLSSVGAWIAADAPIFRPAFQLPSYYVFSIDKMQVDRIRSSSSDTDQTTVTLKVGNWPTLPKSYKTNPVIQKGIIDPDKHIVYDGIYSFGSNLTYEPVVLDLCEPIVLAYSIVNSGDADKIRDALITAMVKGTEDFVNDVVKQGVKDYSDIAIAAAEGSLTGSLLGAAIAVLIDLLVTWLLTGCDGLVAAETITYRRGRDVQDQIALHGVQGKVTGSTQFLASPDDSSGPLCNDSSYTVFSSIAEFKFSS